METNFFSFDAGKKQSLDAWVNDVMMPITEAIGMISKHLEALYQELI
jgi:hypothetical protein